MPRDYANASPTAYQRVPKYKRDDDWIRTFLRTAQVGHIASSRDGQPFINPSIFWFDEEHHQIVFHSNITGRVRSNLESSPRVCFEASEMGHLLPSNIALEFSLQYRSVIVFGTARLVTDPVEATDLNLANVSYQIRNGTLSGTVIQSGFMDIFSPDIFNSTLYTNDIWPYDSNSSTTAINLTLVVIANDSSGNEYNTSTTWVLDNTNR